jgi:hypothetical protein
MGQALTPNGLRLCAFRLPLHPASVARRVQPPRPPDDPADPPSRANQPSNGTQKAFSPCGSLPFRGVLGDKVYRHAHEDEACGRSAPIRNAALRCTNQMLRELRGVLRAPALKGETERPAAGFSSDLSELCKAYRAENKRRSNVGLVGSVLDQESCTDWYRNRAYRSRCGSRTRRTTKPSTVRKKKVQFAILKKFIKLLNPPPNTTNKSVTPLWSNIAFSGVFLVGCSLPNHAGRKPSFPAE